MCAEQNWTWKHSRCGPSVKTKTFIISILLLPYTSVYGIQIFPMQRQELQSENKKLKQDLSELRKSLTCESGDTMPPAPGSLPYSILLEQLSSSNDELEMRKEEVLLLRSHMVRQEALKHKVRTSNRFCCRSDGVSNKLINRLLSRTLRWAKV